MSYDSVVVNIVFLYRAFFQQRPSRKRKRTHLFKVNKMWSVTQAFSYWSVKKRLNSTDPRRLHVFSWLSHSNKGKKVKMVRIEFVEQNVPHSLSLSCFFKEKKWYKYKYILVTIVMQSPRIVLYGVSTIIVYYTLLFSCLYIQHFKPHWSN